MRRVAAVTLLTAVILTAVAARASAGTGAGFWRSAGRHGVDAFGVYRRRPARVTLSFLLRDTKKDRYVAAVRFTFTERHHRRSVRVVALPRGGVSSRWRSVSSANTGHLYVQECTGTWRAKRFRIRTCAPRRRHY